MNRRGFLSSIVAVISLFVPRWARSHVDPWLSDWAHPDNLYHHYWGKKIQFGQWCYGEDTRENRDILLARLRPAIEFADRKELILLRRNWIIKPRPGTPRNYVMRFASSGISWEHREPSTVGIKITYYDPMGRNPEGLLYPPQTARYKSMGHIIEGEPSRSIDGYVEEWQEHH
jgi:hypothetical protein